MKIDKLITEKIEWDIELCKSTANITVDNGKIISQEVSIYKDCPEAEGSIGNRFSSNDPQFIRDVHKALGEYIQHLDGIMRGCAQDRQYATQDDTIQDVIYEE